MSFNGYHFSFDGIPCEEYGLMMYDFGSPQDAGGSFVSSGSVVEDRLARRHRALYYGATQDRPLEFTFVFGANTRLIDERKPLDRWDLEAIASWLTGKDGYRYLEIEQPDMETVRYRCRITDLKFKTVGWSPWAFECKVTCDSPYGYTFPEEYEFRVVESMDIRFHNRSTHNGFYYPKIQLYLFGSSYVNIINHSDGDRLFSLTDLPNGEILEVDIDNENGVITNNLGVNLYPNFNYKFLRLVRGDNELSISGTCNLDFICEFPVNLGG
jgi:phage-related protein